MKQLAVALVVSLCTASVAWPCGNSMRAFDRKSELVAQRHVNEAKRSYDAGKFDQAVAAAIRARAAATNDGYDEPSPAALRVTRQADRIQGLAELARGRPGEAVQVLRRALETSASDTYLKAKLGQALVGSGEREEGQRLLEAVAKSDMMPDADGWVALARARKAGGDTSGAVDAAKHALERDASHAEAKALLAQLAAPAPKPVKPTAAKASTKPSI